MNTGWRGAGLSIRSSEFCEGIVFMEEIHKSKDDIRKEIATALGKLPKNTLAEKTKQIEDRLFDFANFLEAKIALMYLDNPNEVQSKEIIKRTFDHNKIVVLPLIDTGSKKFKLFKINDFSNDLKAGGSTDLQPDSDQCRSVPIDCIDIAIIPGIAFDEKGGRIGSGDGYYDRLIPHLPITTRKVALALDDQIIPMVPVESHDKYVDIIITDKRIIYKIWFAVPVATFRGQKLIDSVLTAASTAIFRILRTISSQPIDLTLPSMELSSYILDLNRWNW